MQHLNLIYFFQPKIIPENKSFNRTSQKKSYFESINNLHKTRMLIYFNANFSIYEILLSVYITLID